MRSFYIDGLEQPPLLNPSFWFALYRSGAGLQELMVGSAYPACSKIVYWHQLYTLIIQKGDKLKEEIFEKEERTFNINTKTALMY